MSHEAGPEDLVRAVQLGDPNATAVLVRQWAPRVLSWCRRLGGSSVDPEDAAQDTMIVALDRIGDLRSVDAFPRWLYRITKTTLRSHRRRGLIGRWVDQPFARRDTGPGPEVRASRDEISRLVVRALEKIPLRQREAVVLVDLEGRTNAEAALLLGVAEGTLKSRLRLGRAALRRAAATVGLDRSHLAVYDEVGNG